MYPVKANELSAYEFQPLIKISNVYHKLSTAKRLAPELKAATSKGERYQERLIKSHKGAPMRLVRRERANKGASSFQFVMVGDYFKPQVNKRISTLVKLATIEKKSNLGNPKRLNRVDKQDLSPTLRVGLKSSKLPAWYR